MEADAEGRIPLTILGGFLGSGKTTWMRHQLHEGDLSDLLIVVNEAADVPVDDMLLLKSAEIRVLAGGCACCEARDDLMQLLQRFCDERVDSRSAETTINGIMLETSGLADPGPIVDAIRNDPVLVHHIVVREIIVAVDALHGLAYLQREPLGRRQAETADRLIVTKADATDEETLQQLAATLRFLNPAATISATSMGVLVELPDFSDAKALDLEEIGTARGKPVISTTLKLDESTDWTGFGLWLSALLHVRGEDIIRVKGVVRTSSGRLLLQSVRKIVQSPEIVPDAFHKDLNDNCLVFIGRGFTGKDLETSLQSFNG